MHESEKTPSPRQAELLEAAYQYSLTHGLSDMSLRPLATAIGSSPRVLLYLYGSKDGLVRALLKRARRDELTMLDIARANGERVGLAEMTRVVWEWLSADEHRALLCLWVEAYARSLTEPDGPWAEFARQTVEDWLNLLSAGQDPRKRRTKRGITERSTALAILRGGLLDLLATGDRNRTTTAMQAYFRSLA